MRYIFKAFVVSCFVLFWLDASVSAAQSVSPPSPTVSRDGGETGLGTNALVFENDKFFVIKNGELKHTWSKGSASELDSYSYGVSVLSTHNFGLLMDDPTLIDAGSSGIYGGVINPLARHPHGDDGAGGNPPPEPPKDTTNDRALIYHSSPEIFERYQQFNLR